MNAKLAEIDAETQQRMLADTQVRFTHCLLSSLPVQPSALRLCCAQRMGAGLLDPELVAKFARKEDLSLPLFQHVRVHSKQPRLRR